MSSNVKIMTYFCSPRKRETATAGELRSASLPGRNPVALAGAAAAATAVAAVRMAAAAAAVPLVAVAAGTLVVDMAAAVARQVVLSVVAADLAVAEGVTTARRQWSVRATMIGRLSGTIVMTGVTLTTAVVRLRVWLTIGHHTATIATTVAARLLVWTTTAGA